MLPPKMLTAINGQINAELYSSYMYLSMACYYDSIGMAGFSNWMRMQAQEEMFHAMKFLNYLQERGGTVDLETIDKPPATWKSAQDAFAEVLKHEQKVTGLINALVDLALAEKDHASTIFLQWFVSEQVEEEATVGAILDKLRLIGSESGSLFILNQEMSQRVFTPPPAKP